MGEVTYLHRSQFGLLKRFASGGQAHLYRVDGLTIDGGRGPFVYKEYKPRVVVGKKPAVRYSLSALARIRENATAEAQTVINGRSAWPLAVVVDDGGATGFVMREIPKRFFLQLKLSTGTVKVEPAELSHFLQNPTDRAARGIPELRDSTKVYLMLRVLNTVKLFHDLGVIIGDFSGANLLAWMDPNTGHGSPFFVDTDSFRVAGAVPAIHQPHTPDWQTPESLRNEQIYLQLKRSGADPNALAKARSAALFQDRASDVYKVALLMLRLFDGGDNALTLRASSAAEANLRRLRSPARAQVLLSALAHNPKDRPTIGELAQSFK